MILDETTGRPIPFDWQNVPAEIPFVVVTLGGREELGNVVCVLGYGATLNKAVRLALRWDSFPKIPGHIVRILVRQGDEINANALALDWPELGPVYHGSGQRDSTAAIRQQIRKHANQDENTAALHARIDHAAGPTSGPD